LTDCFSSNPILSVQWCSKGL